MGTMLLVMFVVVTALVLISRYREYPKSQRPSLNPLHWLRRQRLKENCNYRPDEKAKRFAEQWSNHPTLTRRQAKALKRSLRKKNHG